MNRNLMLNKNIVEELGMEKVEEQDSDYEDAEGDPLIKLYAGGKAFIVPSFFRLILNLRKQKREFAIFFRTFGEDGEKVAIEWNRFCEGTHPCYNGKNGTPLARFDGSKGTKDMRIEPRNTGYVHRTGDSADELSFVLGSNEWPPEGTSDEDYHAG
jgi:hypothetical protein